MGHLYVVCGPPGAGKTTLLKAVASDDQLGLQPLRRTTTRQDRPYEGDSESQSGEYCRVEPAGSVLVVVVSCELGCRPGPGTRNGPTPVRGDGVQVAASAPRSGVGAERRTWRRSSTRGPFRTIARRCPATAASTCRPRWRGPCTGAQSRPPTPGLAAPPTRPSL